MAEATVLALIKTPNPYEEVVQLEVSNGETYDSQKFAVIKGAIICGNENVDAHINVTFSTITATIQYAGQTDKDVTLVLYGDYVDDS